ncbi:MAG: multidrug effflux MFS transporter [Alphaproteobacteria bacterium]|uniref:multidrug effflux MFS transporter n=1 Tax=Hyphomonas sp. TaxID=87 RepID=UPI001DEA1FFB|nr:multidrug effflux MFS transporter [Alphaproteobacteria bacterium]MBU2082443.1 multidrug effflux MFS transporter [Alphaproteobacteria bacterium]MBU2141454.1 multidrug effflux MFS transporter [Alphaproteobacteria bacterium]MBU2197916.1 multidrug effflux MFS transporter [Alphaproteobacteria bacterium]
MADTEPTAIPPQGVPPGAKRPIPGRSELVVMIAGLMALNAFGIDIMLPALNQIAHAVGLTAPGMESDNRQQMIIFSYVLGFGAPQIIWGPISDRFGRRSPLFVALVGYIITALACIVMRDFHALLFMRFAQGVFASGGRLVAVSIVRDLFAGRQMARFMSLVMTIFMVVPILAPGIGQIVLLVAPWEAIFLVLALFGAIMFVWTWMRLPETLPEDARMPLNLGRAMGAYGEIVKSRVTFGYMCASGVIFGALFSFIASSEQIFREVFGQTETFAFWFAGIAGTLACANFLNSRIVEKVGMRRISQVALFIFTIGAAVLSLLTFVFGDHLYIFFPVFALCFGCFGLMGSNFSALAMEPLGKIAGTASAAYGFATTTVASLIGMAISSQYNGSTIPITIGFVCLGIASLVIILITERGRLFSSR